MSNSGVKFDQAKLRFDLLPPGPIKAIVEVLTFGAQKYTPEGWKTVEPFRERYYAAALRHIWDWRMGEAIDPDSGLHHLAHALCNLVFLLWEAQGGDNGSSELRSMHPEQRRESQSGELFPELFPTV